MNERNTTQANPTDCHFHTCRPATMRDIDVVEAMVEWWSGGEAGIIREIADPLISAANRRAWRNLFVKQDAAYQPAMEPT